MRTALELMSVLITTAVRIVMFPNGAKFDATDGFVGAGHITRLLVSNQGTGTTALTCTLWDAVDPNTGRAVIGGTTTPKDRFRLIGGTTAVMHTGLWHNPYWLDTPSTDVTNARKIVGGIVLGIPTQNRAYDIPIGQDFPGGMILTLDQANGANSNLQIGIEYIPWVSGGARRRQIYRPGTTTRVLPVPSLVL